jgi:acetylornithine deacetylase/succinyl-diaminopimelate desuccinylase-like protein
LFDSALLYNKELIVVLPWQSYLSEHQDRFVSELLDFLRIPSISSLPEHAGDVKHAAEWVAQRMEAAGIEHVQVMPTGGHPVVYGDWMHALGQPTILIYGHFDVQPVDPLHLWTSPPFEPAIRDGRVYARGASDDKGNMLVPILAVEALLRSMGGLPVNIKFCLEGQEEIGSPQLPVFLAAHHNLFACDLALSADSGQWTDDQPALLLGLKGLCAVQVDVIGAESDLHSGLYGGSIQNPIHALVRLLDSLRSPEGKILVDGFYDDVAPLSAEDRAAIAAIPFDEAEYTTQIGVPGVFGEPGYSTRERAWARPTLEVNGIWGGFQGEGVKTVLPNTAHAKITCRLVANQEPDCIAKRIIAHVERHAPPGVTVHAYQQDSRAMPYLMSTDHPGNTAAAAVLTELYGKSPYYIRLGGSVPILPLFLQHLGVYTVSFGFALNDERFHAPNEFYRLKNFERGQQAYCMLLQRLAGYTAAALRG